ncbi:hypothetical protein SALBM311S_00680 [Streptomyces alboniger]
MAWAMARRWRMPWEYVRTARSSALPRPAISRASSRWASSGGRPVARQYSSRFSRPDRCGRKPAPSTKAPTRDSTVAPGAMAWPKTRISPASGLIRPISMRRVVVLPAPFGPRRPRTCPFSTRKVRSRTAYRSADFAYRLLRSVIWSGTSASAGSGAGAVVRRRAVRSRARATAAPASGSHHTQAGSGAVALVWLRAVGTFRSPLRETVYVAGVAGEA